MGKFELIFEMFDFWANLFKNFIAASQAINNAYSIEMTDEGIVNHFSHQNHVLAIFTFLKAKIKKSPS